MLLAEDIKTKELVDTASFTKTARIARVTRVFDADNYNENYGKVELVWLDTETPVSGLVDLVENSASAIYGCGIYCMPNVNDLAVCLPQNNGAPIILGFIHPNKFKAASANPNNTDQISYLPKLRAGECLIKGRAQSHIWFKNDGTINVVTKNSNTTKEVKPYDETGKVSPVVYKVDGSVSNNVFEMTLGLPELHTATPVGCESGVFKAGTYRYTTMSSVVVGKPGVLTYNIPVSATGEVTEIRSATLYEGTDSPIKTVSGNNIYYTLYGNYGDSEVNSSVFTTHPCTLDTEIPYALVTLPNELVSLIGKKDTTYTISIEYTLKELKGGIRINTDGDVFIDGRNVVIRSQENKAALGLFDTGKAVLNSAQSQIGDVLGGSISLTRGGIILSAGTSESGDVLSCGYNFDDDFQMVFGPDIYFYVTGDLPLVRYNVQNNKFSLVTETEYTLLSPLDKYKIYPRSYDKEDIAIEQGAFTLKVMNDLMAQTPNAPSYNSLRCS